MTCYISSENKDPLSKDYSIVHINIQDIHIQYLGPYSLVSFVKVNQFSDGVIYVDTEFKNKIDKTNKIKTTIEEDYIDIGYLLEENGYDSNTIIKNISNIEIR